MLKRSLLTILAAGVCAVTAGAASGVTPQPVSPSGLVELRCPMFSWSAVSGATGYELLVYEVSPAGEVGKEPLLSARLPGGAAAWTPPGASCLAAGGRYAWTLRLLGEGAEGSWAESVLFEVAAAPSLGEVEATLARLRRHLGAAGAEAGRLPAAEAVAERSSEAAASRVEGGGPRSVAAAAVPSLGTPSLRVDANVALGTASNLFKDGVVFLWDDTDGNTALGRLALAAATGNATNNTALGREALRDTVPGGESHEGSFNSAVGHRALWGNTTGYQNTASGDEALAFNSTGYGNTASGRQALLANTGSYNTAIGDGAVRYGRGSSNTGIGANVLYTSNTITPHIIPSYNTAIGENALRGNTSGYRNTAIGHRALANNTRGSLNTAIGENALSSNTLGFINTAIGSKALEAKETGSRNTAVGVSAGSTFTHGYGNIFLGSGAEGLPTDTDTIRIGGETGGGAGKQNRTFIAGIWGITTEVADAIPVQIDSAGQLGTASSSREVKQDLREVGDLSRRLFDLRPVAFRYKVHAARDPETPLQFGLIAEEVAEVFPELVVRDGDGRPQTVKYHLLRPLLLNELQRAEREREQHRAELRAVRDRLTAVEEGRAPERSAAPWWRRPGDGGPDQP